ncbi:unnamed protein product [Ilex paraguariensis]|uniref:Uncharacterized protein n=1 Tax=Ilex paraguariensis TaxID=185542 RepID=A0ABC8SNV4_9AQUA
MRSSLIISLCLLVSVLYFVPHSVSSSPLIFLPGRRPIRELRFSSSIQPGSRHKIKIDGEMKRTTNQDRSDSTSTEMKRASRNGVADELLYHIDYHGVTTHPTPTPKHPRP